MEDNPFYDLFSAQERDLDFEDFLEPIDTAIENQIDFFMRFRDPHNEEFDDIPPEVKNDPINVIMQITSKLEDEICINFMTAGFDDDEIAQAWKLFLKVVKERCKELM